MGLAVSVASTVVLLRGLMDQGLLNTEHGRVAVGWLVFEDLATVFILVLLPALFGGEEAGGSALVKTGDTLLGAAMFVGLMLFVGARVAPWLLTRIIHTRSRELFILAVVAIALGTAVGSAELFGVSLALGAFLAGVLLGTFSRRPARTALVVAAGLSQIGEFSFIVGQAGVSLGVLTQDQYSLILAGALLSIMINPFMFRAIPRAEALLRQAPVVWKRLDRHVPQHRSGDALREHVVVVGSGRVGEHIVSVLGRLGAPRLVVERDEGRVAALEKQGVAALFGDAANSDVLDHAGLDRARALVVTVPDEAAAEMIVAAARRMAPDLPVVARAATRSGVRRLRQLGARDVIHPELEGGLETMMRAIRNMDIQWAPIPVVSWLVGQTLAEANIRARTEASVIAVLRGQRLIPNPKSAMRFESGDVIGLIGDAEQVAQAQQLINTAVRVAIQPPRLAADASLSPGAGG